MHIEWSWRAQTGENMKEFPGLNPNIESDLYMINFPWSDRVNAIDENARVFSSGEKVQVFYRLQ